MSSSMRWARRLRAPACSLRCTPVEAAILGMPEAVGKVDHFNPTQFGRALAQLGIEHIAAYSPEALGRSKRAFGTHRERLPVMTQQNLLTLGG